MEYDGSGLSPIRLGRSSLHRSHSVTADARGSLFRRVPHMQRRAWPTCGPTGIAGPACYNWLHANRGTLHAGSRTRTCALLARRRSLASDTTSRRGRRLTTGSSMPRRRPSRPRGGRAAPPGLERFDLGQLARVVVPTAFDDSASASASRSSCVSFTLRCSSSPPQRLLDACPSVPAVAPVEQRNSQTR